MRAAVWPKSVGNGHYEWARSCFIDINGIQSAMNYVIDLWHTNLLKPEHFYVAVFSIAWKLLGASLFIENPAMCMWKDKNQNKQTIVYLSSKSQNKIFRYTGLWNM